MKLVRTSYGQAKEKSLEMKEEHDQKQREKKEAKQREKEAGAGGPQA
jgi:hypothetical protein